MLPEFDENGNLPPGIHRASLVEIAERFGRDSEVRRVEMESLNWLADLAMRVGVERVVIEGSFVTDTLEPNDVDCVLLVGTEYPRSADARQQLLEGLPFLHIQLVDEEGYELFVRRIFAVDKRLNQRGLVEVIL
jgi:hypothetical protein